MRVEEEYMKLTILGNNGAYPRANGACSGYLLTSDSGDTRILIDCGTGVLNRLMDEGGPASLDAVMSRKTSSSAPSLS